MFCGFENIETQAKKVHKIKKRQIQSKKVDTF